MDKYENIKINKYVNKYITRIDMNKYENEVN